jgi:hypothetical protein
MLRRLDITSVHLLYCCCCRCHTTIHDFTYTLTYLVLGTRRSHHLLLLVPLHLALQPSWWWWWCCRLPCHSLVEVPRQGQPGRSLFGAARRHWWWWRWWLRRRGGCCWWWRGGRKKRRGWWCLYQLSEREIKKANPGN